MNATKHSHYGAREIRADGKAKTNLKYQFAELNVELECMYGNSFYSFREYGADFDRADIKIAISQSDIDEERVNHPEIKSPDVFVTDDRVALTYDYGCLEPFVVFRRIVEAIIPFNVFAMHGSVVAKDGNAYMFTAPSGTGKTTRTRLWLEAYPDSIVVNGDKPFIKMTDDGIFACGTPWSGKEGWNTNTVLPLRAIFILERSEDNLIEKVGFGKAFPALLRQTHRPNDPEKMRKTLSLLQSLNGKVDIYAFRSRPAHDAVRLAYEIAKPK